MKKLFVLAAFAFGVAMTHQAVACDWDREASKAPVVVADGGCTGSNCATEQAKPETDTSKVACEGNNCPGETAVSAAKLAGE
jgi:hypothetical protein